MTTTFKSWDINAIKSACRVNGSHWFDPDTLRYFRGRVLDTVYQGPGGIYFVSSEQYESSRGERAARRYSVRQFLPPAEIDTVGEFNTLTKARAQRIAGELATTPLEQQLTTAIDALAAAMGCKVGYRVGIKGAVKARSWQFWPLAEADTVLEFCAKRYKQTRPAFYLSKGDGRLSEHHDHESEVCRVLATYATPGATVDDPAITVATYRKVSRLEQFRDDCRKHGNPKATVADCRSMRAMATSYQMRLITKCNRPTDAAYDARTGALGERIKQLAAKLGAVGVLLGGDPRGCTVKLQWADGETNDFGREGWCVPMKGGD